MFAHVGDQVCHRSNGSAQLSFLSIFRLLRVFLRDSPFDNICKKVAESMNGHCLNFRQLKI